MFQYSQDSDFDDCIDQNNLGGFYQPFNFSTDTQTDMTGGLLLGGYANDAQFLMSPPMSEENARPFLDPNDTARWEKEFQTPIPTDPYHYKTLTADHMSAPVSTLLDPVVRSTTPDTEPPFTAQLSTTTATNGTNPVPGGFTFALDSALAIPSTVAPTERFYRKQEIVSILDPHTDHPLPPPSPTIKNFVPDAAVVESHRIRKKPARVTIPALPPKPQLDGYQSPAGMPDGPEKQAVIRRNNELAALKSASDKLRNNVAAARSRDRKKRAIVHRAEAMCGLRAELGFWKARAVGLGARVADWDGLDGNVKREMVADRRFDAFDFSYDVEGEERVAEVEEKLANKAPAKKTAQKKRKAKEMEE